MEQKLEMLEKELIQVHQAQVHLPQVHKLLLVGLYLKVKFYWQVLVDVVVGDYDVGFVYGYLLCCCCCFGSSATDLSSCCMV